MSKVITFVADEKISALSAVLNPIELRNHLRPVLPSEWGALQDIELQVLKHHRGKRCAIEITLQTTSGKHELIGKVYAVDRSDVFRVMKRLARSGFGPEDEYSIPQPLAYLPSTCLLVYEKAQGPRAKDVFLASNDQSRTIAAKRCALWLARFHATEPQSELRVTLTEQLNSMEGCARQIAHSIYPFEAKASRLYKQLKAEALALAGVEACAGHGSYSSDQVVLAEGHTVTIDWDGYDVSDPARDVARFIIELRRLALSRLGSIRALDAAAEVFLQTYLGSSRFEVMSKIPYYEAATCLKATGRLVQRQSHHWYKKAEALLNEGLRVLEREVDENKSAA
jgi:aminoglycoside phosphotransferase (APT) family kinase protein